MLKKILIGIAIFVAMTVFVVWLGVRKVQGPELAQGETDLRFTEVDVPWAHKSDLDVALPFMAIAAIDVNNDGVDELFAGGGTNQQDIILQFNGAGFEAAPASDSVRKNNGSPTYGAASLDVTGDGLADLFVAREDGVWFFVNTGSGFSGEKIPFEIAANTAPLSVAIGDIDGDGWADLYISGYIKIAYVEGETVFNKKYGGYSYLLKNNGDNTWTDVSAEAGVWRQHNTFTAAFLDLDRDRDSDLVIAQDTGVVEMYENIGAGKFSPLPRAEKFSYPMGIGFGDYDNDGLIDLYFSNVGNTLPSALVRGDLREDQVLNMDYILLHNDKNLQFSDLAIPTKTASHGFGWGVVMQDMDLDGRQDLIVAQNYARFPGVEFLELYNGRLLKQYPDGTFAPVEKVSNAANPNFGMSPVIADFDRNGHPDLVWANMTGPLRVLLNAGGDNNWLAVRLPDNVASLGALVIVRTADGKKLTDTFATSEGLGSDQSHELLFGLGSSSAIDSVHVEFAGGEVRKVSSPALNSVLDVAP